VSCHCHHEKRSHRYVAYVVYVLVFAQLIACLLVIVASWPIRPMRRDEATKAITRLGGRIEYSPVVSYSTKCGKDTLVLQAGIQPKMIYGMSLQRDVSLCDMSLCIITDSDAMYLSRIHDCAILSLRYTSISPDSVDTLLSLSKLEVVDLRGQLIDLGTMETLLRLRHLRCVFLSRANVSTARGIAFTTQLHNRGCDVFLE